MGERSENGPQENVSTLLAIDAGNTRIKAAWFRGFQLLHAAAIDLGDDPALLLRQFEHMGTLDVVALASVNRDATPRLLSTLDDFGWKTDHVLGSDGSLFERGVIGCGVTTPKSTGVDRLLSSVAARKRSLGRNVIVVDCGSAVTVNLTAANGVFQGGAILPGARLMLSTLHQRTSDLPQTLLAYSPPKPIGGSTDAAIQAGVYFAIAGGIERLIEEFMACNDMCLGRASQDAIAKAADTDIYLTGGDASLIAMAVRRPHCVVPTLVLEGLAITVWEHLERADDA